MKKHISVYLYVLLFLSTHVYSVSYWKVFSAGTFIPAEKILSYLDFSDVINFMYVVLNERDSIAYNFLYNWYYRSISPLENINLIEKTEWSNCYKSDSGGDDNAFGCHFNDGYVRGVPYKNAQYSALVDVDIKNINHIISCTSKIYPPGRFDYSWSFFGMLTDGSVFYFIASCCRSGFDVDSEGRVLVAPDWDTLFFHLTVEEREYFIIGLNASKKTIKALTSLLSLTFSENKIANDILDDFFENLKSLKLTKEFESSNIK